MQVEQFEILDFLRAQAPFDALPPEALDRVARAVEVRYYKAGTRILAFGQAAEFWFVVRSGAVEVYRRSGVLYNRLTAGGHFGEYGLLRHRQVRFPAVALEDSLCYLVPEPVFTELFEAHEAFADHVEIEDRSRLRTAVARRDDAHPLLTARVDALAGRALVTLPRGATAVEAARRMTEAGVSSLLVTEADDVAGILTDRDLRTRLLAAGLPGDTAIDALMSADPVAVAHDQPVFEAQLLMLRHNVHHLPVLKAGRPIGLLALSDIIRHESRSSLFLVGNIFRQPSVDGLAALAPEVRACFSRMVGEDASARMVGSAMAAIGRGFKQRLLELAEAELGPPPRPYAFLALGSMARDEQLVVTDQDNAMILDDRHDEARDGAYFEALSRFVSDGLARCGYPYCSGGVMASNPRWRLPLRRWRETFETWVTRPTPETLLHASIFFDLDGVAGETGWVDALAAQVARLAQGNARFLACMARNALQRTPPLGFFKDFVVESDGRHTEAINLKRRGTAPLVDLIRVHALAIGSTARNSYARLDDIVAAGILPRGRGPDLHDALDFIATVRARHQADDIAADREPDNSIEPAMLSDFERRTLRDAFRVLADAQRFLKFRYQPGRAT